VLLLLSSLVFMLIVILDKKLNAELVSMLSYMEIEVYIRMFCWCSLHLLLICLFLCVYVCLQVCLLLGLSFSSFLSLLVVASLSVCLILVSGFVYLGLYVGLACSNTKASSPFWVYVLWCCPSVCYPFFGDALALYQDGLPVCRPCAQCEVV
jgi:hypothetical protein